MDRKIGARLNAAACNNTRLGDVASTAHMHPSQRTRLILMREGTLQKLSTPPQQTLAPLAFLAPLVGVHRRLLLGFPFPVVSWLLGAET
jgi:hypothetical protein